VQKGHRARVNAPGETVPDDQVGPRAKLVEEGSQIVEPVTVVSIGHDDVTTPSCGEPAPQRRAVTPARYVHNPRSLGPRDVLRSVA
jgi:hypothetical protein